MFDDDGHGGGQSMRTKTFRKVHEKKQNFETDTRYNHLELS
jgi:hypothetical protein